MRLLSQTPQGWYLPSLSAEEALASSIEHVRARTARQRQCLKELNEELAVASSIKRWIKNEVAACAGGPLSQLPEGKNAALMATGEKVDGMSAAWRYIHPQWEYVDALKSQWEAEALGHQQFAEDSMPTAALVRVTPTSTRQCCSSIFFQACDKCPTRG